MRIFVLGTRQFHLQQENSTRELIIPIPASVLCLDLGQKRIGLAGCDPLGITITQLQAIHRKTFKEDLDVIRSLCLSRKVVGLVIGLPLDENGHLTNQARHCFNYGSKLAKEMDLPLVWVNEHSSSWEAQQKHNLKNDRSGKLDSAVAALLLEQWLREGSTLPLNEETHFSKKN